MFVIDTRSDKPIYEQIIDNIKELSLKGILKSQDRLPSIRELAGMLTVNPNTVNKAYQELERQNVIETVRGKGTFMCEIGEMQINKHRAGKAMERLKDICIELSYMGFEKKDIIEEVENIYDDIKEGD